MMLAERILESAATRPHQPAIVFHTRGSRGTIVHWTYGELETCVRRASVALSSASSAGEAVGLLMVSEGGAVAAILAAQLTGHPAILVPASLPSHEARALLRDHRVTLVGTPSESEESARSIPSAAPDFVWVRPKFGDSEGADQPSALTGTDAFICQLTSGSMGASRLAVRSDAAVASEIEAVRERLALGSWDSVLCASSIAHSYGLIGGLLAPLLVGAQVGLTTTETASVMTREFNPTVAFGLAATYGALLAERRAPHALRSARFVLSAGAPLPDGLFDAFLKGVGLPIRQDYGTTETGTISIDDDQEATPGSVGRPLPHLEVRLARPAKVALGAQEQGEIWVRSAALASGYLNPDGFQSCVDADGWYHTRDAGWFDSEGRLFVGRRLRDPVSVDGVAVDLEAVETAIRSAPGVKEAVALGVRDGRGRSVIRAVIVAPGVGEQTLRDWCREHLCVPEQLFTIELRDDLPRSPAGKILQKYML